MEMRHERIHRVIGSAWSISVQYRACPMPPSSFWALQDRDPQRSQAARRRSAACSRCWKHRVKAAPPRCRQHSIASRSVGVVLDRMMEVVLLPIWLSSATNACQVGLRVRLRLAAPAESMACPACRSHTRHSAAPRKNCAAVARLPVILEVKAPSTQQCPMFNNSLWSRAARGSRSLAGVQRPNAVVSSLKRNGRVRCERCDGAVRIWAVMMSWGAQRW